MEVGRGGWGNWDGWIGVGTGAGTGVGTRVGTDGDGGCKKGKRLTVGVTREGAKRDDLEAGGGGASNGVLV